MRRRNVSPSNRKQRQEGAKARQEAHDVRTPAEQLAVLDKRFGKGKGAAKERARLEKKLAKGKK